MLNFQIVNTAQGEQYSDFAESKKEFIRAIEFHRITSAIVHKDESVGYSTISTTECVSTKG
jgi:hypothetical protein